jgi:uncharacterized repeat protein (TIGR01451 family)
MKKILRTSLSLFMLLVLSACNLFASPVPAAVSDTPVLRLNVRTRNGSSTFSTVGEVINYEYIITNTGASPLTGSAAVADTPRQVTCPEISTVGNQNANLEQNESITCTAAYSITESDVTTGSVINVATATVGGVTSNQSGITLTRAAATSTLTLTKSATPQTYGQLGQTITYNYTLTNTGTAPLGPAQFVVTDNKLAAPLNCGPDATTLAPSQSVTCSAPYLITQADMSAPNVTNSASATGGGQTSASATTTITNTTITGTQTATPNTPQAPPSNLSPGSTIQHQVAVGEWLIQIGRCYGAAFEDIRDANPQIADPDFILPSMLVSVPRIGSAGRIYGPPCITFHTVQSGDTWESIAQRYNADLTVLRKVNPVTLSAGTVIKIPLNSAGAVGVTAVPTTATATVTATTATAIRINIPAGQTTVSVAGVVNPSQTVSYVLSAAQGQVLTLSLSGPASTEVTLGVTGPTGIALKQPDGTFTWTTTVSNAGDHFINVASVTGSSSKAYTLTVSLTSGATGTATVTATATLTPTPTSTTAPQ